MKLKTFLVVTLLLALTPLLVAQNGAPASYRLGPNASKLYVQIEQAKRELEKEYKQLEAQRLTLLVDVPADARECVTGADGIVVCAKPKPPASPSPSPRS